MFAPVALARRIEEGHSSLIGAIADAYRARDGAAPVIKTPIAGGLAVFTTLGAPWNKVSGMGFERLDEAELAQVEREYALRCSPVQVEFPALGDNTICPALTARGYALVGFENVLGLDLGTPRVPVAPPGITITPLAAGEMDVWADALITGFEHPDPSEGPRPHETFSRALLEQAYTDMADAAGFRHYLARVDGQVAGGASLFLSDGVAQLCGAATLPAHRRRGVQTALFEARLRDAVADGCDVATVTTQPGSKSQENSQRRGFHLLYTRAILVLPADRPAPSQA